MYGKFIVFDGGDGTGKTTLICMLKEYLDSKSIENILVREPGGCSLAEEIRKIILTDRGYDMSYRSEALLYAAARAQLVEEKILKSLHSNKVVLCDRYIYSSLVYQGALRGVGIDYIYSLNEFATQSLKPDLVFWIYASPDVIAKRLGGRNSLDRLDNLALNFRLSMTDKYKEIFEYCKEKDKELNLIKLDTSNGDTSIVKDIMLNEVLKIMNIE